MRGSRLKGRLPCEYGRLLAVHAVRPQGNSGIAISSVTMATKTHRGIQTHETLMRSVGTDHIANTCSCETKEASTGTARVCRSYGHGRKARSVKQILQHLNTGHGVTEVPAGRQPRMVLIQTARP